MDMQTRLLRFTLMLVGAAMISIVTAVPAEAAWGWQKPLNQRLGAFYTSNNAFKKSTSTKSGTSSRRWIGTRRGQSASSSTTRRSTKSNYPTAADAFFFPGRTGLIPFNGVGGPRW